MINLTKIFICPLKGAKASSVSDATITTGGLVGDRQFAVVVEADSPKGERVMSAISRKEVPSLALIGVELLGNQLVFSFPQRPRVKFSFDKDQGDQIDVTCFRHHYVGSDMGDEIGNWLTSVLGSYKGKVLRLAKFLRHKRITYPQYAANAVPSGFYDRHPLTVVSSTSMEALNREMMKNGYSAVEVERFGPTLVFDGIEPFEEHRLGGLKSGEFILRLDEPVVRCGFVAIDPKTSVRDEANGLTRALKSLDIVGDNSATFGMCASLLSPRATESIQVGQEFDPRLN